MVSLPRATIGARDELTWGSRRTMLGRLPEMALQLPLAEGTALGPVVVVPIVVRSEGAWVRISSDR